MTRVRRNITLPLLILIPLVCADFARPQTTSSDSEGPISAEGRLEWAAKSTLGPQSLTSGLFSSGFSTALNHPPEYGPHWEGFGKRYAMRLTGIATNNTIEAGLGAAWGEDPRYFRAVGEPVGTRIGHAVKMTFLARSTDGGLRPAYARYVANAGGNFLSNTWRVHGDADAHHASVRILEGFLGRMTGNLFKEFFPDLKQRLSRKRNDTP